MICKTYKDSSPNGLIKVLFCATADDYAEYYEEISGKILELQKNVGIYYADDINELDRDVLESMRLVVAPVTKAFLDPSCSVRKGIFDVARECNIPVLPILKEAGIEGLFNKVCGEIQFLDDVNRDETAIGFMKKLKDFLENTLISDETIEKIRKAFDAYIFLSYRKKDRKHANEIMKLIHDNDFMRDVAIWYDEYLVPGENFNDSIEDALLKSSVIALVVTPNLVNEKNYVQQIEYPMAVEKGKVVLPLESVATDPDELKNKYTGISDAIAVSDKEKVSEALLNLFSKEGIKVNNEPTHLFMIGLAYLMGIDVEVDTVRAFELIHAAFEGGLTEAGEYLKDCLLAGRYFWRDYKLALSLQMQLTVDYYKNNLSEEHEGEYGHDEFQKYADYADELVRICSIDAGYTDDKLISYARMAVAARKKVVEEFPDKETGLVDILDLASSEQRLIHYLGNLPEAAEEGEIEDLCGDVWNLYVKLYHHTGIYSPYWDILRLAYNFSRAIGPKVGMSLFINAFQIKAIYNEKEPELSDEDSLELAYSGTLLTLESIQWCIHLIQEKNYTLEERWNIIGETYGKTEDNIDKFCNDQEEIAVFISGVLLDKGRELDGVNLRNTFLDAMGTLYFMLERYEGARTLYLAAFSEMREYYMPSDPDSDAEPEVEPYIYYAQIDNCINITKLGEAMNDSMLTMVGYGELKKLYRLMYDATRDEEFLAKSDEAARRFERLGKGAEIFPKA